MTPLLLALLAATVDAPITDVTVFSDRARVTRTATVTLGGTQPVELPVLSDAIDAATVRVEVRGGELVRVDLQRLLPGEFPVTEA
ncbi:MAG: DUF4140 domain-containing protein, partial [Myxococcales bacterium]